MKFITMNALTLLILSYAIPSLANSATCYTTPSIITVTQTALPISTFCLACDQIEVASSTDSSCAPAITGVFTTTLPVGSASTIVFGQFSSIDSVPSTSLAVSTSTSGTSTNNVVTGGSYAPNPVASSSLAVSILPASQVSGPSEAASSRVSTTRSGYTTSGVVASTSPTASTSSSIPIVALSGVPLSASSAAMNPSLLPTTSGSVEGFPLGSPSSTSGSDQNSTPSGSSSTSSVYAIYTGAAVSGGRSAFGLTTVLVAAAVCAGML